MPEFDRLPMDPAVGAFANPRQAQIATEYMGYIDKLGPGKMGRLRPAEGESLEPVRKRLGVRREVVRKAPGDQTYEGRGLLLAPTPWASTPKALGRRRGHRQEAKAGKRS